MFLATEANKLNSLDGMEEMDSAERAVEVTARLRAYETLKSILGVLLSQEKLSTPQIESADYVVQWYNYNMPRIKKIIPTDESVETPVSVTKKNTSAAVIAATGQTIRVYDLDTHGKDFQDLAKQMAEQHVGSSIKLSQPNTRKRVP